MAATAGFKEQLERSEKSFSANKQAFERLPDEIIEQILLLTNPNSFASLIILNRKWRQVSQQAHLYAYHLSRCPSYSAAHPTATLPEDEDSLPRLRRLFGREIKRNLFEAYLRPNETIINIVSTSISSSSAPGGEAFHFSLSPRGHFVLAYSSSRLHVIDVTGVEVVVKREFKILRRPASATITDDGLMLAVLSTDMQVDLYDLSTQPPKHTKAVALDHTPRTIALSPTGSVLAAAYDAGVEVSSLNPNNLNSERRAVKCYAVDSLSFSRDGTQLLGTTMQSRSPSTVILTAPYYDPGGSLPEDSISALWTTSILFPNGSRDCSHAVLLPSQEAEASWSFTYDRVFETFRAVRIDDLRNGTTYFTGPIADASSIFKLLPSTLPAASESGELVAAGFQSAIWLYGVPEDLEAVPVLNRELSNSTTETEVSTPSSASIIGRRHSTSSFTSGRPHGINRIPQWQLLCDRLRNTFVEGRKIGTLDRISALAWVDPRSASFSGERLVGVAPGVAEQCSPIEEHGMSPIDGGRIGILDFAYSPHNGKKTLVTIEVGMNEPEVLEEEYRDLDTEVAMVRRRTVAQRRGNRSHVSRSATAGARSPRSEHPPPLPTIRDLDQFMPRIPSRRPSQQTTTSTDENASVDEDQDAFDAPYSQTNPRSGATLRRAATAAAVNRRLHPRAVAQDHIEYRRADGREEHPHESDADNWVPPPPPYTREPVPPLPEHIQRSLLAEAAAAALQRSANRRTSTPSLDFPGLESGSLQRSHTIATIASSRSAESRRERFTVQRSLSAATSTNVESTSFEDDGSRPPMISPASPMTFDDLYDVSPPDSPQLQPQRISNPATVAVNQIPRRPVGAPPSTNYRIASASRSDSNLLATLQQPLSPIPQPNLSRVNPRNLVEDLNCCVRNLDTDPGRVSPIEDVAHSNEEVTPPQQEVSPILKQQKLRPKSDLFKDVPTRPDDSHHLTGPPPVEPDFHHQQKSPEPSPIPRRSETVPIERSNSEDMVPIPIWRRAETAPVIAPAPSRDASPPPEPSMSLPSADQLARLNSRKGRPAGLTDPRRPSPGPGQRPASGSHSRNNSGGSLQSLNMQNGTPPRLTPDQSFRNIAPRAAVGAHGSPQRLNPGYGQPLQHNSYNTPPSHRRTSNGASPNRHPSPNLRPPMQRLETIHSQTSSIGNGEPSPYFVPKSAFVTRQPSRAERSAAKNIKDAKKKGWRSEKKKSKAGGDGASSAGWTDVSREYSGERYTEQEKKDKKCVVM